MDEGYKRLVEYLRDARQHAGISQVELAKKLHRSQSFVSKYERGEQMLSIMETMTNGNSRFATNLQGKDIGDAYDETALVTYISNNTAIVAFPSGGGNSICESA